MNKKGITLANFIYIMLAIAVFTGLALFIADQYNGASVWADYYAKEITRTINYAQPDQTITLDVHKATEIARSNNIIHFNDIFQIDNPENLVCVQLSQNRRTCYHFFNEVDIIESKMILGRPNNMLQFNIQETP